MCVCACLSPILYIYTQLTLLVLIIYFWTEVPILSNRKDENMPHCSSLFVILNYFCNCYINADHIFFWSIPKRNLPFFWQENIFWERCMAQSLSVLESDRAPRASLHTQVTACVPICCSAVRHGKTKNCLTCQGRHNLLWRVSST